MPLGDHGLWHLAVVRVTRHVIRRHVLLARHLDLGSVLRSLLRAFTTKIDIISSNTSKICKK